MKDVEEKWWHRLLAVASLGFWLLGTALAALIAWDASKQTVYSYNWHAATKDLESPIDCDPALYPSIEKASFYCGEFDTTTSAVDDMIATGFIINPDQVPSPRSEYSDGRVLESVHLKHPLKYEWKRVTSPLNALKYGLYAIGSSIVLSLVLSLVWKLVFFIAYGANHRIIR